MTNRSSEPAAAAIRCACGHAHRAAAWSELRKVATLTGHDVHAHVIAWPADAVVEVRACGACGRGLARMARAADTADRCTT